MPSWNSNSRDNWNLAKQYPVIIHVRFCFNKITCTSCIFGGGGEDMLSFFHIIICCDNCLAKRNTLCTVSSKVHFSHVCFKCFCDFKCQWFMKMDLKLIDGHKRITIPHMDILSRWTNGVIMYSSTQHLHLWPSISCIL